ncbi:MAG: hypothetical protein HYW77_02900 [Parcubacteria group bacterium]|nr:hypothetical protein [Parcubacteria group bacterium]
MTEQNLRLFCKKCKGELEPTKRGNDKEFKFLKHKDTNHPLCPVTLWAKDAYKKEIEQAEEDQ